jgi:hypothetical protein
MQFLQLKQFRNLKKPRSGEIIRPNEIHLMDELYRSHRKSFWMKTLSVKKKEVAFTTSSKFYGQNQ